MTRIDRVLLRINESCIYDKSLEKFLHRAKGESTIHVHYGEYPEKSIDDIKFFLGPKKGSIDFHFGRSLDSKTTLVMYRSPSAPLNSNDDEIEKLYLKFSSDNNLKPTYLGDLSFYVGNVNCKKLYNFLRDVKLTYKSVRKDNG